MFKNIKQIEDLILGGFPIHIYTILTINVWINWTSLIIETSCSVPTLNTQLLKAITVVLYTCLCKRSSKTDSKISRMQPLDPDNKTISTTPVLFLDIG